MKNSRQYYRTMFKVNDAIGKYDLYTDEAVKLYEAISKLKRLAKKHHRLAEMSCNGVGVVRGQVYYNGTIDEWAKKQYGYRVKSAYIDDTFETDVFDVESQKAEDKIRTICQDNGLTCEFQGDPRGYTVKVSYNGRDLSDVLWA